MSVHAATKGERQMNGYWIERRLDCGHRAWTFTCEHGQSLSEDLGALLGDEHTLRIWAQAGRATLQPMLGDRWSVALVTLLMALGHYVQFGCCCAFEQRQEAIRG